MAKLNTPEERAALIEECKSSGLTVAEFCRRRGVGYSTMFKWMGDAGTADRENGSPAAAAGMPRFVEVETEGHEDGAAFRPAPPRAPKKLGRPSAALCAELVLPGGVVLRIYYNSSTAAEGGAA